MKRQYRIYQLLASGTLKPIRKFAIYDQERSMCILRALFVLETLDEPGVEYQVYDITEAPELIARRFPARDGIVQLSFEAEQE